MPFTLTVTITNLQQFNGFADRFGEMLVNTVSPNIVNGIGQVILNYALSHEHRISGAMAGSTQLTEVSKEEVIVSVSVLYAVKENARPGDKPGHGPHNFWEPSIADGESKAPGIIENELRTLDQLR